MKTCPACGKEIKPYSQVAVLSRPLVCDEDGDYTLISDFFRHEKVLHDSCLIAFVTQNKVTIIDEIKQNGDFNGRVDRFRKILESVGEKPDTREIITFVASCDKCSDSDMLTKWYQYD